MGFLHAVVVAISEDRQPGDHQVGADLHRRFDGFAGSGAGSQDRQAVVAGAGRRAGGRDAGHLYTYEGKEYVLFVAGGNSILEPKVSDQLIAYGLPD